MAEITDWKARYRDALRDMEHRERGWRDFELALRRLIGRLCRVGTGQSPSIDAALARISHQMQLEGSGPAEIEALSKTLLEAVTANDCPRNRWEASCNAAATLFERLSAGPMPDPTMQALASEVAVADSDEALAKLLMRAAEFARAQAGKLAKEREAAAAMLTRMTQRLEDIATFLDATKADWKNSQDAALGLDQKVMSEVDGLSKAAMAASDLAPLQVVIATRLESIASHVQDFRDKQGQLYQEQMERAEKMTLRVAELENRAQDLSRSLEQERALARLDVVTGVPNRIAFEERLREELARWKRLRTPISMLIWDIDRFKTINDTYGHRTGDRVLREVASCFANRLRTNDFVARIGGEEFCTLLIGTNAEAALRVANDLREAVANLNLQYHGKPLKVTVSCGITSLRDSDLKDDHAIFERADSALYRAKEAGRNMCIAA
ncbi:MAG: GGDEF domain-containing protein [Steroidobacteraceae bacterium]|nr:diguanylate cyclase [Nevskiaceae bacterium]MCP5339376.1 diguanylate cyclase [Nevskiaceae bacterium]MCP5466558.1 diguanylate cyclase [Nevskiaceae bacterium]MCP5471344.1 diguanylate cyclase [Nevskiaceae bacterium]